MRRLALLGLAAALSGPARAEDAPERVPTVEEAAPLEAARRALEAYEAGDFARAGEQFTLAFELSGNPTQLRNAARAFERAGRSARALAAWRRYLTLEGLEPDKRALAEASISALEARIERDRLAEEAARLRPEVAAPHDEPAREPSVLRWTLIGAGAATAGAGVALYGSGYATYLEWSDDSSRVTRADVDAAQLRAGVGVALFVAGVAAAGLGVALPWLLEALE